MVNPHINHHHLELEPRVLTGMCTSDPTSSDPPVALRNLPVKAKSKRSTRSFSGKHCTSDCKSLSLKLKHPVMDNCTICRPWSAEMASMRFWQLCPFIMKPNQLDNEKCEAKARFTKS